MEIILFKDKMLNKHLSSSLYHLSASGEGDTRSGIWEIPSVSPIPKTCKLTKHSALGKTYLVPSLPIRMLSRSLILWRHCFEMTSSTFDVKNKNPTPYSIRTQSDNIYHAANAPEIHIAKTGYNSNYSGPRVRTTLFKARLHTMPWVLELRQMIQSL